MSDPPTCAVDRFGARRHGPVARRVGWLEALSLAQQVACGLGFVLVLGGALQPGRAAVGAVAAGGAVGAAWLALRTRVPAVVPEPSAEPADREGDDSPWTLRDLPWAVVTAVAVAAYVVLGLLVVHWLLVVVALTTALAVGGVSLGAFAIAVGYGLGVSLLLEVLVERPLSRRWGIPL